MMQRRNRSVPLSLGLSFFLLAAAPGLAQSVLDQSIAAEVARAQRQAGAVGVEIVDLYTGQAVYSYNPDAPLVIASNSKLFTTAAALDTLGPGFQFETRFLLRGTVAEGVLRGDLGVVGSGDPQISGREYGGDPFAVFRPWAAALRERGIRRVAGDLYLAHGLFEALRIHPDWPRDQLAEWYEAPIDALSFSDNCILVRVSPGKAAGQPAIVETVPPVPIFRVDNTTSTRKKRRGTKLYVGRTDDLLTVRGTIDVSSGPFETWITVPDPVAYFGGALRAALAEEGIAIDGALRPVDQLPGPVWQRVAVHKSDLVTAVRTTNKRSQNFYAESLAKQVGAKRCGHGSWTEGVKAIAELVASIGIVPAQFHMVDGSGMSRENQASPRAVTTLLRHMFFHPAGSEFVQSLPYAGEEDAKSWKRRLGMPPYRGNVFAKTGTLAGVSALSGYARSVSGKSYAFSILLNGTRGDPHGDQDRIVMALIDHG
ncbi:MAG TPA: D-alanyl-D-alanine carboxypeptidase/D-alanyl-D-alanine-endopeptidase [Thermoanaerobaculia bacterium]|nr:D-alanyl-D-alanine carboxypeptidase/D-alanyl-D-alanine-endopeptidase [Thermoanaerobaculia bacterium]